MNRVEHNQRTGRSANSSADKAVCMVIGPFAGGEGGFGGVGGVYAGECVEYVVCLCEYGVFVNSLAVDFCQKGFQFFLELCEVVGVRSGVLHDHAAFSS